MNRKLKAPKNRWYFFIWPFLVLASVLLIIWSPNGLLHLRELQVEHQELLQKNHTLEKENQHLYEEISRLQKDPDAIESLARQELGLVREDELIFQFIKPKPGE
jgi:cell division protein FtsB